jgi:S-ribosylhomocysteine lyase LuxS involved in autoinducer biosynthesis
VILQIEPVDEETENYISVENEATLNAVYEIFKDRFKDVLTFAE